MLKKEKDIYHLLEKADITPRIVSDMYFKTADFDAFYVTEYIEDSKTLRQVLKDTSDYDSSFRYIKKLLSTYNIFVQTMNEATDCTKRPKSCIQEQFHSRLYNLMLSGPDLVKNEKLHRFFNRIVVKFFEKTQQKYISKMTDSLTADASIIHGDFHLNNLIINQMGKMYLIDFENVSYGSQEIELAYMYAQIWGIVNNVDVKNEMGVLFENYCHENNLRVNEFWCICRIYCAGIALNRVFMNYTIKPKEVMRKWGRALNALKRM